MAEALARAGHDVTALARNVLDEYSGVKRLRLLRAESAGVNLVGGLPAEGLSHWVARQNLDLWVHHHHPMDRFRSPDYDVAAARAASLIPLPALMRALAGAGVRGLIYSGTYFEPREGGHDEGGSVTPYARLKHEVSLALSGYCAEYQLKFAKVVIPAPAGALENEDRLTPQLILAASRRQPLSLRSPDSVMDALPGEALAKVYLRAAERLDALESSGEALVFRPSGKVLSAIEWAEQVRATILSRLNLADSLLLQCPPASQRPEPARFRNPADQEVEVDWDLFADAYAREWRDAYPFRWPQS